MAVAEDLGARYADARPLALTAEGVEVTYEVWEDHQARSLKALVAHGFRRPQPRRVQAVRNVSFDLHEGEALGLVGVNGSGKTSLLRAIAGLLPVQGGRIRARSEPVMLGVGAALHPQLSGRRNVYLGGTALGLTRGQVESRFDEIVEFAGVGEFIDMPLRTYSAGMNARLRFSIAASVEPDILLIDEALGVGDVQFKRKSEQRMRGLIAHAGALVLVSHSLGSIEDLCTRVIWLHQGELLRDGPTAEVLEHYRRFTAG
jgi:teichoic acid transport system ATP-binding protein